MAGVTAGGNTVLLAGRHSSGYRVGPQGSTAIDLLRHGLYGSEACTALLRDLIAAPRPHLMESELAAIALRSIATDARLRDALATVPPPPSFAGVDTPLAGSCASWPASSPRASRWARAAKVFFVSQNGYDNHTGLRDDHPALLRELGQALAAFQAELDRMGMADQVTTFTASEFGRTLGSNGNGSDHGWGGHHLVLGGAVRGGAAMARIPISRWTGRASSTTAACCRTWRWNNWAPSWARGSALAATNWRSPFPICRASAPGRRACCPPDRAAYQIDHSPPAIRRSLSTRRFQRAASLSTNRASSSDEPRRTSAPCSAILAATPASASA